MRKVIYERYGSPEVLTEVEVAEPTVGEGEVCVDVRAVALNPLDWKLFEGQLWFATGWRFPRGVGIEFAGEVLAVGRGVQTWTPGAAVFGMLDAFTGGALAERLVVRADKVHVRPAGLSFAQAAALPIGALSAMQIVDDLAAVQPGSRVLVNGAAGGVGAFVTQVAKRRGARVTAVVSPRGVPLVERWGVDEVVDYTRSPVTGLGARFDVVVDLSGALPFSAARALMVPRSVYVDCNPNPVAMAAAAVNNALSSRRRRILMMQDRPEQLAQVCAWVEGGLEVVVGRTWPLSAFREAYTETRARGTVGKLVLCRDGVSG
jgi:NADPH:quinone reductase-like Zn-dependent oxidoreductase